MLVAVEGWAVSAPVFHTESSVGSEWEPGNVCSVNKKLPPVFYSGSQLQGSLCSTTVSLASLSLPQDHSFGIFAGMLSKRI